MAPQIKGSAVTWSGERDEDMHRTYKVQWLVVAAEEDGPAVVMLTPGLPLPGTPWLLGNDIDLWAWCRPQMSITPRINDGEATRHWDVEQTFSTKPPSANSRNGGGGYRCHDTPIEDPLLEPQKISGSSTKEKEEASFDRNGLAITNSAFEPFKGPKVEFDRGKSRLRIEQNVPLLQESLVESMRDHVNDAPIWGFPTRCVKLSDWTWERKFYGQCYPYYTRTFEFECDPETFDRNIQDEGTKCLRGRWIKAKGSGMKLRPDSVGAGGSLLGVGGLQVVGTLPDITVTNTGSGYPAGTYIAVHLKVGASTGGVVVVYIGKNGISVTPTALWHFGTGYVAGTPYDVEFKDSWAITPIENQTTGLNDFPSFANPAHMGKYTDPEGNPAHVILDGFAIPVGGFTGAPVLPGNINVQKYSEANFLLLGIPTVF